jgi:hypothetical protein
MGNGGERTGLVVVVVDLRVGEDQHVDAALVVATEEMEGGQRCVVHAEVARGGSADEPR